MIKEPFLLPLLALALACATTAPPAPATLPVQPQRVASALAPAQALDRVSTMLRAQGVEEPREVLGLNGRVPKRSVAWASGKLDPDDLMGSQRCLGAIEVVQASAEIVAGGRTQLGLSCHTERLVDGPSGPRKCEILRESGCVEAGDQMVGRLALDAVGL